MICYTVDPSPANSMDDEGLENRTDKPADRLLWPNSLAQPLFCDPIVVGRPDRQDIGPRSSAPRAATDRSSRQRRNDMAGWTSTYRGDRSLRIQTAPRFRLLRK